MRMSMRRARSFSSDVRQTIVNESRDEFVDDAVVGFTSLFTSRNELQMSKKRELVTYRRHRQTERMSEIADTKLLVRESVHQAKTKRIGQREKDFDRFGGGLIGGQRRSKVFHLSRVVDIGQRGLHS
jgi:hypothetical protein